MRLYMLRIAIKHTTLFCFRYTSLFLRIIRNLKFARNISFNEIFYRKIRLSFIFYLSLSSAYWFSWFNRNRFYHKHIYTYILGYAFHLACIKLKKLFLLDKYNRRGISILCYMSLNLSFVSSLKRKNNVKKASSMVWQTSKNRLFFFYIDFV